MRRTIFLAIGLACGVMIFLVGSERLAGQAKPIAASAAPFAAAPDFGVPSAIRDDSALIPPSPGRAPAMHHSPMNPIPAASVTAHPVPAGERLRVTDDGRFLARTDGSPFFYLGDTAWELFHRLTREEADLFLRTRAEQGYTVIQAVALAEFDGLRTPNPYGDLPLHDLDPTRPNEAYFAHVDWVVRRAAELGMYTGLLPTWGDKWCDTTQWGGPVVFNAENARVYGEFLGRRYRDLPIVWILGGDRSIGTDAQRAVLRAMAEGLAKGDGGSHLRTLHPRGGASSADYVHDEPWLDFNMLQSGHTTRDVTNTNYPMIERDYARRPVKPCMDSEPRYEDHPIMSPQWQATPGEWFDDHEVRKAAYWALFAGAHGHTYGCHDVWQMFDPAKHEAVNGARTPWQKAILLPGARQMIHARRLLESRPYFLRVPDRTLLVGDPGEAGRHIIATRATDGSYAFVYTPVRQAVTVDLGRLREPNVEAAWYDPRTGESHEIGRFASDQVHAFTPPAEGPDWVLTLDSAGS